MQSQPHTGSYYAATVGDVTDFEPLTGERTADVCVIGAGFTGISTALFLAERGYDVHVVEANRVGWGASGRNGGQMIGGISGEETVVKLAGPEGAALLEELRWAGHAIIRERVDTYGIDCDLKYGYLDVAVRPRQMRDLEAEHDRLADAAFAQPFRLLSADEVGQAIGTGAYIGGLLNMANGHLHPLKLCVGEARAAQSLGVTIYERSPVIEIGRSGKPRVEAAQGAVTADAVVIAGNAYHSIEPRLRGILFPVNSFIIATAPLPAAMVAAINPQDLAVCDQNFVLEYFRLSADKRLLFGGRCNYFGSDPAVIERQLRPRMARIYPRLADVGVDFAWGGRIGVPVNRVPQFGRLDRDVYYCQGFSGHGVNVTHLAGRIMADALAGTVEQFDLFANIRPVVVPGGHLLQKPLVALAMMYYRIRDRL